MAEKNYTVEYNITAQTSQAEAALKTLSKFVTENTAPIETLASSVNNLTKSLASLARLQNLVFKPEINTTLFREQLMSMTSLVRAEASKMSSMLMNAMTGNPIGKKAISNAGMQSFVNKSISQVEKEISQLEKSMGNMTAQQKRAVKTSIDEAKSFVAHVRDKVPIGSLATYLSDKDLKQAQKNAEKQAKEAAQKVQKGARKGAAAAGVKPEGAQYMTTATVNAIGKVFGKTKSKTLTVRFKGDKKNFDTVLKQVNASLAELPTVKTIEISPVVNQTALATARQQLGKIIGANKAGGSAKGTAPTVQQSIPISTAGLTAAEKKQLSESWKKAEESRENIRKQHSIIQSFKGKDNLTPAEKGKITKATNAIKKEVTGLKSENAIISSLSSKSRERSATVSSARQQLAQMATTPVRVELTLDLSPARAMLRQFLAEIAILPPQQVRLAATPLSVPAGMVPPATAGGGIPGTPVPIPAGGGGTTSAPPATGAATGTGTTGNQTSSGRSGAVKAPSGFVGTGASRVFFGSKQPEASLAPKGYRWVQGNLAPRLNAGQAGVYQGLLRTQKNAIAAEEKANKRLNSASKEVTSAKRNIRRLGRSATAISNLQSNINWIRSLMAGDKGAIAHYGAAYKSSGDINDLQAVRDFNRIYARHHRQLQQLKRELAKWQDPAAQEKAQNRLVTAQANLTAAQAHIASNQATWNAQKAAPAKYASGWQLVSEQKKAVAEQRKITKEYKKTQASLRADRIRTERYNAALKFAPNATAAKMVANNWKFFEKAWGGPKGSGVTMAQQAAYWKSLSPSQRLAYLESVAGNMAGGKNPVMVPAQLQSEMNRLTKQIEKAGRSSGGVYMGGGGKAPAQASLYDRTRKALFPFTGVTDFRTRKPMMVDMAKGMGVMFAIGGAMSMIQNSFSQATEYQNVMRTTQAVLKNGTDTYTETGFKNMERVVRDVGVKTKFSAPEVADAARFLAMAGMDINDIIHGIRPIADVALIGDSDLGETADKMTNIMTTFRIPFTRMREVANILTSTATRSNTTVEMLAESANYGGGVAKMYGGDDPNLFADTMAMFGIMGNAGIQASSAGTALRMMYQNIYNPNKKQGAIGAMLKSQYGIATTETGADGKTRNRSMADIIFDMANKIEPEKLPGIIGKMFRITAMPGAMGLVQQAKAGDQELANMLKNSDALADKFEKMSSKESVGALLSLMLANRKAATGNISTNVSYEKQNTVKGLFAQVTSSFTEAVVKAFESTTGSLVDMLKELRDYMSSPELMKTIRNILDLVTEVAKVLGFFVKLWLGLYNTFPGFVKVIMIAQMAFNQLGYLMTPFVQFLGVASRIKAAFASVNAAAMARSASRMAATTAVTGASTAAASAATAATAATAASGAARAASGSRTGALLTGMAVGNMGKQVKIAKTANARAQRQVSRIIQRNASRGTLSLITDAAIIASVSNPRNYASRQINGVGPAAAHQQAVIDRAKRIYGVGNRMKSGFLAGRESVGRLNLGSKIATGFRSIMAGLATGIGMLCTPAGLAIAGLAGVAGVLTVLISKAKKLAAAKEEETDEGDKKDEQGRAERDEFGNKYNSKLTQGASQPEDVIEPVPSDNVKKVEENNEKIKKLYAGIIPSDGYQADRNRASAENNIKRLQQFREELANNDLYRLAQDQFMLDIPNTITDAYLKREEAGPNASWFGKVANKVGNWLGFNWVATKLGWNWMTHDAENYDAIQSARARSMVYYEGAQSVLKEAEEIEDAYKKFSAGEITKEQYEKTYKEIIARTMSDVRGKKLPTLKGKAANDIASLPYKDQYWEYWQGRKNFLDRVAAGNISGTVTAQMTAMSQLRPIAEGTQNWVSPENQAQTIGNILSLYPLNLSVPVENGNTEDVQIQLKALKNGAFDQTAILTQVREKANNFKLTISNFASMASTVYKMMAKDNLLPWKQSEMEQYSYYQIQHRHVTKEDAIDYFNKYLAPNRNNPWIQAGFTSEQYANFVTGNGAGEVTLGNGATYTPSQARVQLRKTIANRSASAVFFTSKEEVEKALQDALKTSASLPGAANVTTGGATAQAAFGSSYPTPQQPVNQINIAGNLCSFENVQIGEEANKNDVLDAIGKQVSGAITQLMAGLFNPQGSGPSFA